MAITRRAAIFAAGATIGTLGTRVWRGEEPTIDGVKSLYGGNQAGFLNDASKLSKTSIHKHIIIQDDPNEVMLSTLRAELSEAAANQRPVNLAAARHSMGGQSIPRNGHAITFDNGLVEPSSDTYWAHAGARWRHVISKLAPAGLSPKVMQSNNDFGVAASFSVNAHGWPTAFGPMGSTVRSVKMLLADGSHISASPSENSELFYAAMGGYGLIGLITELEVEAVKNTMVEPMFQQLKAESFAQPFAKAARESPMAFGRLNIDRRGFFEEAVLVSFRTVEGNSEDDENSNLQYWPVRNLFRSQSNNDWVKRRRWDVETGLAPMVMGPTSRSNQMNKAVAQINGTTDAMHSDILHEYFVHPDQFSNFVEICREIIPSSYQDLLNVTLRWVEQDKLSLLSYAPSGPRIAAVLNFGQELSQRAEDDAVRMTRRLIDAVHSIGGSYYLPYRPHATVEQFLSGYERSNEFAAAKRRIDPKLLFRNAFWDNYLDGI